MRLYSNTVLHVRARVGALMCAFVCACARARIICIYDYYIILLYMRVQCVRMCVGTCVRTCMCVRVCAYVYANVYAYVCAGG